MQYTEEDYYTIVVNMEQYGGSFTQNLGKAMRHADLTNRRKIANTWPELMQEYLNFRTKG